MACFYTMSKTHIFSKCTQNITRIVISFISYNEHSNLPPTLQAQQLPTAMLCTFTLVLEQNLLIRVCYKFQLNMFDTEHMLYHEYF